MGIVGFTLWMDAFGRGVSSEMFRGGLCEVIFLVLPVFWSIFGVECEWGVLRVTCGEDGFRLCETCFVEG